MSKPGRCMAVRGFRKFARSLHGLETRATVVASICLFALGTFGAPPVAPPLPEGAERVEQGLAVTFESADGKITDARTARLVALYVPAGAAPTPFVGPGKFRATFSGDLNLRLRERMAFVAEGRGKVTVKVKDKVVFEAEGDDLTAKAGDVVRLDKGKNPFIVTYESPPGGDAVLRLKWK